MTIEKKSSDSKIWLIYPLFRSTQPQNEGGRRKTKSCSNQKSCLEKSVCSAHVTIEKWFPFFDLGGLDLFPQPPSGGEKTKSWSDQKTYLAKRDMPWITKETKQQESIPAKKDIKFQTWEWQFCKKFTVLIQQ